MNFGKLMKWSFLGGVVALVFVTVTLSCQADQVYRADQAKIKSLGMPLDMNAAEALFDQAARHGLDARLLLLQDAGNQILLGGR